MISYIHLPIIALSALILTAIWRLWVCIDRLNLMREVSRKAPSMFHGHLLSATLAIMQFLIAIVSWFGITLPQQTAPMNTNLAAFISLLCLAGCFLLLKNTGQYLALSWAGSREGALRVVAMLRIIDAAELAYALQFVQARETANAGRVIDAETLREVRK